MQRKWILTEAAHELHTGMSCFAVAFIFPMRGSDQNLAESLLNRQDVTLAVSENSLGHFLSLFSFNCHNAGPLNVSDPLQRD